MAPVSFACLTRRKWTPLVTMRCTGCNRQGGISCYPVPRAWVRNFG